MFNFFLYPSQLASLAIELSFNLSQVCFQITNLYSLQVYSPWINTDEISVSSEPITAIVCAFRKTKIKVIWQCCLKSSMKLHWEVIWGYTQGAANILQTGKAATCSSRLQPCLCALSRSQFLFSICAIKKKCVKKSEIILENSHSLFFSCSFCENMLQHSKNFWTAHTWITLDCTFSKSCATAIEKKAQLS